MPINQKIKLGKYKNISFRYVKHFCIDWFKSSNCITISNIYWLKTIHKCSKICRRLKKNHFVVILLRFEVECAVLYGGKIGRNIERRYTGSGKHKLEMNDEILICLERRKCTVWKVK